ncbi:neutrophil cytosol factor 1 isoform X1 [Acanthopagrus latus]|uniref:neutrophil cytosol factor 1 isoform X1 n=1 Tax=Acanthopagrus latus TaxID=8177 RepID=UPI00187CF888|nr:neutrophil cytosol factor 1 isoform X1 [Acanthopagrus latus]XP_036974684.1 neutrophil cytosol factor 1 isoform X1 [Acanthopagrus latus]
MEESYVRHVELLGFEKRLFPTQHFIYMLMVKWSDLSEKLIYRTYPEIHTFHKSLKEMFPIESGEIEKKDRIIPSLPAPRWLDSQKSTETRQTTLAEYCRLLINLPPHISRCKLLTNFFKVRPEDENPPAPNTLKRDETFALSREINRGNTSDISGPIILDTYRVIADFIKTSKHELNLHTGDLVEIVEKNQNGWWFCQHESKHGWVPASYLEPLDGPEESEEAEPNYEGKMFMLFSPLNACSPPACVVNGVGGPEELEEAEPSYEGELHITINAYKAEQEDEISLELGETIEVIHKLLDGWWVVRKGDETGHFPSMFLQKASKRDIYEVQRASLHGQKPPPRRSTIRNAKSIHNKTRQRLTQDTYRRNSRRYLQQKGGRFASPRRNSKSTAKSPLTERKNQDNIPEPSSSSSESEMKKEAPVIPPRPSPELILERCSDNTRKKVSIRSRTSSAT